MILHFSDEILVINMRNKKSISRANIIIKFEYQIKANTTYIVYSASEKILLNWKLSINLKLKKMHISYFH